MVPTSLPLKNAVKNVACAQISVLFKNTIIRNCLQKGVYTYVSVLFLVLSGVSCLIVAMSVRKKLDESEEELGD